MDYDPKKIEEKIKSLPEDLQEAMFSVDIANKVIDVAEKFDLDIDQAGKLSETTSLVMLGFIPTKKFVSELSRRADIDQTKAGLIAQEVNDKIFNDIRTSLQNIQAEEQKQEDEAIARANTLKGIENPTTLAQNTATPTPVNLLAEYPAIVAGQEAHTVPTPIATPVSAPATAPAPVVKSINLLDQFMSAPVTTKNPQPQAPSTTSDPYREPIA